MVDSAATIGALMTGATTIGRHAVAGSTASNGGADKKLFDISLAQWSIHKGMFGKKRDHLDFAKAAKEEFGIDAIEFVNQFFKDKAKDETYLEELNKRAKDLGVTHVLIMIDGEGQLGDPDQAKRDLAVENHKKWVDAAKILNCHSIRVNAGSDHNLKPEEQHKLVVDGLGRLAEYGKSKEIGVIVENHGHLSSNGAWLAGVIGEIHKSNSYCGTLPDFGNFRISGEEEYDKYKGTKELMPFAKGVSAKSYDFDADGNETVIDYEKMMRIVLDAGYRGRVGIEYEGNRMSEEDGIIATRKLLERLREKLAADYK
jgi:sugar phosphate isomerase/epimerase